MSPDAIAAAGAFLSGAGSVLGAWIALRSMRKRMEKECAERLALLEHGIELGERLEHPEHRERQP